MFKWFDYGSLQFVLPSVLQVSAVRVNSGSKYMGCDAFRLRQAAVQKTFSAKPMKLTSDNDTEQSLYQVKQQQQPWQSVL